MYHAPTTLPPLQVDSDKNGKDSDHDIVIMTPKISNFFKSEYSKKAIKIRPMARSQIDETGRLLSRHEWPEVFQVENVNLKASNLHNTLRLVFESFFPEKTV